VAGTVTGEIFWLTNDNTPGAASQVIVNSYPAGLPDPSNLGPAPIDVTAWGDQIANQFTESNGLLTSADFDALSGSPEEGDLLLNLADNFTGDTFSLNAQYLVPSGVGSNVAAYTPVTAIVPTPEPASAFLLAGVLLAVGFVARKRMVHVQRSV
jgi:hypothetical protein